MGTKDSSKTRVAPLFDQLFARDPSGASWLDALIALGSRAEVAASVTSGQLLVKGHRRRWGSDEAALPAPATLLLHLVRNTDPQLVLESSDTGDVLSKRTNLASRDEGTIRDAVAAIESGGRGKKWYVLEGDSKPDALLEGERVVLCVEGKRTEAKCTTTTQWMRMRSQLVRHMDAAYDSFPGKRILGLMIVEGEGDATALQPSAHWVEQSTAQHGDAMIEASLPHRDTAIRSAIRDGMLGVTTWQAACAAVDVNWISLPDVI